MVDQKLSFEAKSHHVVLRGSLNEMLFLPELEEREEQDSRQESEHYLNTEPKAWRTSSASLVIPASPLVL